MTEPISSASRRSTFEPDSKGTKSMAVRAKMPAGHAPSRSLHPTLMVCWIALVLGAALAVYIGQTIDVPVPVEPQPEPTESSGAIEVFVKLMECYLGVYQRTIDLTEGPSSDEDVSSTLAFVIGAKERLRTLDLTGVYDPTYGGAIRDVRDAMLKQWHELGSRLENVVSESGKILKQDYVEMLLDRDAVFLRYAAQVLALSRREFAKAVKESMKPIDDTDPDTEEIKAKRARDIEALLGMFDLLMASDRAPTVSDR